MANLLDKDASQSTLALPTAFAEKNIPFTTDEPPEWCAKGVSVAVLTADDGTKVARYMRRFRNMDDRSDGWQCYDRTENDNTIYLQNSAGMRGPQFPNDVKKHFKDLPISADALQELNELFGLTE